MIRAVIPPTDTVAAASPNAFRCQPPRAHSSKEKPAGYGIPATSPANEDVRRLHARFTLAIDPDPTQPRPDYCCDWPQGHVRELSSLVLVVARIGRPALSRVPRASMASVGGQPTLCLRRFLQVEA